jgi:hypothetical protein
MLSIRTFRGAFCCKLALPLRCHRARTTSFPFDSLWRAHTPNCSIDGSTRRRHGNRAAGRLRVPTTDTCPGAWRADPQVTGHPLKRLLACTAIRRVGEFDLLLRRESRLNLHARRDVRYIMQIAEQCGQAVNRTIIRLEITVITRAQISALSDFGVTQRQDGRLQLGLRPT